MQPYWQSECGRATVYVGDCREVLARLEPDQFHAVVTDPPYGLEFMGKDWDAPWKQDGSTDARQRRADELSDPVKSKYLRHNTTYGASDPRGFQTWFEGCADAILHVARPGTHLLSFGGTRMWHRMACAIEDVGWEIRDVIMWVYGSGFPKGMDISKALDKMFGAKRQVVGTGDAMLAQGQFNRESEDGGYGYKADYDITAPATDAAKYWDGWNTALKPAYEPVIMARKQPVGSIAENTLKYGCGGLNVDACRVGSTGATVTKHVTTKTSTGSGVYGFNTGERGDVTMTGGFAKTQSDGRHPSNLIHDGSEEATGPLPEGAARYFYTAKANAEDRPHGKDATIHPTVKPLELMRYLVRLVCTRGGLVLDPFTGSGSTGCAAILEGMRFVGVEKDVKYADIAIGRIKLALADRVPEDTPDAWVAPAPRKDAPPPAKSLWGTR